MNVIDLKKPTHSYFYGFSLMDGNLYKRKDRKNGGRFTVCLSSRDESILYKFEEMFGDICKIKKFSKQTNFTKNKKVDFTAFVICNLHFVDEINNLGFPFGKKGEIVTVPDQDFCEDDFFRGIIDADGSIGITERGIPFIKK